MSEEPPIKDSASEAQRISHTVEDINKHGMPVTPSSVKEVFASQTSQDIAKALFQFPPEIEYTEPSTSKLNLLLGKGKVVRVKPEFTIIEPPESDIELAHQDFPSLIPPQGERTVQPHHVLADIASYLALPTRPDNMSDDERVQWREHTSRTLQEIGDATGQDDLSEAFRQEYKRNQLGTGKIFIVTGNVEHLHEDMNLPDNILEMNTALKEKMEGQQKESDYSKMSTEEKLEVIEETRELARTVVKHFMTDKDEAPAS